MHLDSRSAVTAIVLISFALTLLDVPRGDWFTLASMSLAAGVAAMALMAVTALLGGRLKFIESLFGGLDRVYRAHKWLAIWALVFASFHFVFRAGLRTWDVAAIVEMPAFHTRLVRQLSLLALVFILLLALNRRIPYHRWRWWHKLSGPLFLIVVLHWLSIRSPIALASPAGIWLGTLSALGIAAAAYKLLLYRFISNHAEYRVVRATSAATALHMELEPVDAAIRFKPGQFGFISMKEEGMREPHPFTLVGGTGGNVHVVIRDLGDYTHRLVNCAKEGMYADIYGPYGRFARPARGLHEVWIAGGVGISPFLAWLTGEEQHGSSAATLFYFFTPGREFPSVERIRQLALGSSTEVVPVGNGPQDPAFTHRFEQIVKERGPANIDIAFCGPQGLLQHVRTMAARLGVPAANLRYEYFEFR